MTLRIQYVSDLHLEHRGGHVPVPKIGVQAPILVLAGDIGHLPSRAYRSLLEWANGAFEHTFLVLGNHEYYGQSVVETPQHAAAAVADLPRVHWLHRSVYDHPAGVRFAGATLWSDVRPEAFARLMDRKGVRWEADRPFTRENYAALHAQDRAFFEQEIEAAAATGTPLVCISHHAPLLEMNGAFGDNALRSGFCTDLHHLLRPPVRAWISGHTHQSLRVDHQGVPCVANCLGYPSELGGDRGFRVGAVIEV